MSHCLKNHSRLLVAVAASALGMVSCRAPSQPIAPFDYAANIVGNWQGTVGNEKELMTLNPNGTFVCRLRPLGFIANTLSESRPGTIRGTWALRGRNITLRVASNTNEYPRNRMSSSTIIAFKHDELTLKTARGETSTFTRFSAH
jgi:hypothetical protein